MGERYDDIPEFERQWGESSFGKPNWYVPAGSDPPYITDSLRDLMASLTTPPTPPDTSEGGS